MRNLMRRRHYSIHTERAYRKRVKRHIRFHNMQPRDDLRHGEEKIEAFPIYLVRDRQVAASTRNQAMNAFVFLYLPHNDQAQPRTSRAAGWPSAEAPRYAAVALTRFGGRVTGLCPLAFCCRRNASPIALMS